MESVDNFLGELKYFCRSKNLCEPSYQFKIKEGKTDVMAKCHVGELVQISFGNTVEEAVNLVAQLMLETLKLKYSVTNTSNHHKSEPQDSEDNNEVIAKFLKYYSKNVSLLEDTVSKFPNLHLSGGFDPFFTDNKKMQELKTTSLLSLMRLTDPFALIEEILNVQKVKFYCLPMRTVDDTFCTSLVVDSEPIWSMIGKGTTYEKAKIDVSRNILMFFKTMVE